MNQKALEFFEPKTIETLQSAICAPFYCIFSWVVCFNFSGGNFVKADYSRIIIRIPLTQHQTQKILSEVDGNGINQKFRLQKQPIVQFQRYFLSKAQRKTWHWERIKTFLWPLLTAWPFHHVCTICTKLGNEMFFAKCRKGILLPKLFWPTVRKNRSSNQEKLLKFEAEGREFEKF